MYTSKEKVLRNKKKISVSATLVGTLFLVARIADGFCDLGMGINKK